MGSQLDSQYCYTKQDDSEQDIGISLFSNYNTEVNLIYDGFIEDNNDYRNLKIYLINVYEGYLNQKSSSVLEGPINNNLNIVSNAFGGYVKYFPSFIIALYDNSIQGYTYYEVLASNTLISNFNFTSFKNFIGNIILQNTSLNSDYYSKTIILSNVQFVKTSITDVEVLKNIYNEPEVLYVTFSHSVIISLEVFGIDYKDSNYNYSRSENHVDYNLKSSEKEYYFITLHLPVSFSVRMQYSLFNKESQFDVLNSTTYDYYFKEFKTSDIKDVFLFSLIQNKENIDLLNGGDIIVDLTPYEDVVYTDFLKFNIENYTLLHNQYINMRTSTLDNSKIFKIFSSTGSADDLCTLDLLNNTINQVCFKFNKYYNYFTNKQINTLDYEFFSTSDAKLGEIEFLQEKLDSGEILPAKIFIENFYPQIYNLLTGLTKQDIVDILVNGQKEFTLNLVYENFNLKSIKIGRAFIYWTLRFFVDYPFDRSGDRSIFFNDDAYSNLRNWVINNYYFNNHSSSIVYIIFPFEFVDESTLNCIYYPDSTTSLVRLQSFTGFSEFKSVLEQELLTNFPTLSGYHITDEDMMFLVNDNINGSDVLYFVRSIYTKETLTPLTPFKDALDNLNIFTEYKLFLSNLFNIDNYSYSTFMFFINSFLNNNVDIFYSEYEKYFSYSNFYWQNFNLDINSYNAVTKQIDVIPAFDLVFLVDSSDPNKNVYIAYELNTRMTFNISNNITDLEKNLFFINDFSVKSIIFITSFSYKDTKRDTIFVYPQMFLYVTSYFPMIFELTDNGIIVYSKSIKSDKVKESIDAFYNNVFKKYNESGVFIENLGLILHPHVFPFKILNVVPGQDDIVPAEIVNLLSIDYKSIYRKTSYVPCLVNFLETYEDLCSKYGYHFTDDRLDDHSFLGFYKQYLTTTLDNINNSLKSDKKNIIVDVTLDTEGAPLSNNKVFYAYSSYPSTLKYFIPKQTFLINTGTKQYVVARLSGTDIDQWYASDSIKIKPAFVISNYFCINSEIDINLVYKEQIETTVDTRLLGFKKSENKIEVIKIDGSYDGDETNPYEPGGNPGNAFA